MYEAASQIRLGIEPYLEIRSAKSPAVAPDGELLAYLSDESGTHQIWLRPLAGGAPWRLTDMPEPVGAIAFNPKSRDLLFTMDCGGDERHQLWLVPSASGVPQPLTEDPSVVHVWGCWAPDGQRIAFASNARDREHMDIYVMDMSTRAARRVFEGSGYREAVAFFPDGRSLLVADATHAMNDQDLFRLDLESGAREALLPHEGPARYAASRMKKDGSGFFTITDQGREFLSIAFRSAADGTLNWTIERDGQDIEAVALAALEAPQRSEFIAGGQHQLADGDTNFIRWVESTFTIPNICLGPDRDPTYSCAPWVGLSGNETSLQAGWYSYCYYSNGQVQRVFSPWWRWAPSSAVFLTNFAVLPGDVLSVVICLDLGSFVRARISLNNVTSTRSISPSSLRPMPDRERYTPSMNTTTELSRPGLSPTVPMPRMRGEAFASVPVEDTSSDGASWFSWRMSFAPEFRSDSAVTADTATGTSASTWARPCAVTTMSLPISSCCAAVSAGAVVWGWVVSTGTCASAGAATKTAAEDSRTLVRRMIEPLLISNIGYCRAL